MDCLKCVACTWKWLKIPSMQGGEFFQRSSYYQHSPSSCASYRFLRLRLGGGLDRGGGGRLLWHNNIYQTRITLQNMAKHIRHRHMHKSKSLWCANQYFTWMRLTGGAQLYLPSSALSDYWANRRCQIGLNFCFCKKSKWDRSDHLFKDQSSGKTDLVTQIHQNMPKISSPPKAGWLLLKAPRLGK